MTCTSPARADPRGPAPPISRPPKRTPPALQGRRPETALSSVVLPAPFGPSSDTTSPAPTRRSTPCSTAILPYPASSLLTSSSVSGAEVGTDDLLVHADLRRRPGRENTT